MTSMVAGMGKSVAWVSKMIAGLSTHSQQSRSRSFDFWPDSRPDVHFNLCRVASRTLNRRWVGALRR
jgi:hypothetical protein